MSDELMPFDLPQAMNSIIKVIGVGGGGSNAVNHMYRQGIQDVEFVVCNTDEQALENSPVPLCVQLGESLTEGRGAGNKPERGRQAAIENLEDVIKALGDSTKMVFITAGMGGGTGTGAAPILAKATKDLGILTVGIVTIPFRFEGQRRISQAITGIRELNEHVDSLLVINNEKLREIFGDLKLSQAFSHADDILTVAAKGIAEIITVHGHLNVDFADVQTVMTDSGVALMGSATASGEDRAIRAIQEALNSPLLNNNDISGAKNILLNITSGTEEATMDEIGQINDYVQEAAGYTADLIWGNGIDNTLGEKISVTVIATGFQTDVIPEIELNKEKRKTIVGLQDTAKNTSPIKKETSYFEIKDEDETVEENPTAEGEDFVVEEEVVETNDVVENARRALEKMDGIKKQQEKRYSQTSYSKDIDELENEPAYKRKKYNLDNATSSASEVSKYSLSEDEEEKIKLRSGNSYLHDRVD